MKYLALNVPGFGNISNLPGFQLGNTPPFAGGSATLGQVVSGFLNIAFLISGFLLIFWLSWGVFQYIFAGGEKEGLAKARGRITWALVGFLIIILAFAVSRYVQEFFPARTDLNVAPVSVPPPYITPP